MCAQYDLSLDELKAYRPARTEPADFDAFWQGTLAHAHEFPLNAKFEPYDSGLRTVETFDVTFNGYAGQPIKGWLLLPRQRSGPLPCVVEYIGYGGGRGFPHEWLVYSGAGYAHLIMDTRGQGSAWRRGDTPDIEVDGSTPQFPGFMTRGILDAKTYYYRRVFIDAARAIEAARSNPAIDASRIAVSGGSQGGGITLAASYLVPDVVAALPDVPFLCAYRRATQIIDTAPYNEITRFLKTRRDEVEKVFTTLSYFDGVNFSAHAKAKALFSVGLMDDICPPSTVYAAYNHYAGPKQIEIYSYNNHEGGEAYQVLAKMRFLQELWGRAE